MVRTSCILLALIGGATIHSPLRAQDDPVAPFRQCGEIAEREARLDCFDAALRQSAAEVRDRSERRARRSVEDFGLTEPQVVERDRAAGAAPDASAPGEPDRIESTLQEVFTDGRGKKVFLLANGQVWRETSASTYRGIIRDGWTVEVRKGGVGGYRLSFEGRTGMFAVARVR